MRDGGGWVERPSPLPCMLLPPSLEVPSWELTAAAAVQLLRWRLQAHTLTSGKGKAATTANGFQAHTLMSGKGKATATTQSSQLAAPGYGGGGLKGGVGE